MADAFANKRARCLVCGAVTLVPDPNTAGQVSEFDLLGAMGALGPAGAATGPATPPGIPPIPPIPSAIPGNAGPWPVSPVPLSPSESGGFRLGFRINQFVVICVVLGVMLMFFGVREWQLAAAASPTPQAITCLQLESNGPGKNTHVHLSGFTGLSQGYIYEYEKSAGSNVETWKTVYTPVVSVDGPFIKAARLSLSLGQYKNAAQIPPPPRIKVVLKSSRIHDATEQAALASSGSVDGLVVNRAEPLEEKQVTQLAAQFPGTDFTGAWVVEVGRKPAMPATYFGLIGGGAALLLLGLYLMLRPD